METLVITMDLHVRKVNKKLAFGLIVRVPFLKIPVIFGLQKYITQWIN